MSTQVAPVQIVTVNPSAETPKKVLEVVTEVGSQLSELQEYPLNDPCDRITRISITWSMQETTRVSRASKPTCYPLSPRHNSW